MKRWRTTRSASRWPSLPASSSRPSTPPSGSWPGRSGSPASAPGRPPAGCSRPTSARTSPGSRRCVTPCRTTTRRPSRPKTSTPSPRPSWRSPPGRKTATSSSTPSSQVRPQVEIEGYDALQITVEDPAVRDEEINAQIDQLRERFADLEDSTAPLSKGDYAQLNIKGYIHDEEVPGLTVSDFLYEVGSELVVPKLDTELEGKRPGRHAQVQRRAPGPLGRPGRRGGRLPGAGQGDQAQGAPRGQRRVGPGGQRVRHPRRPPGRHPRSGWRTSGRSRPT